MYKAEFSLRRWLSLDYWQHRINLVSGCFISRGPLYYKPMLEFHEPGQLSVVISPRPGNASSNSGRGTVVGSTKSSGQIWCPLGVFIIFSTVCSPRAYTPARRICFPPLFYRPSEIEIFLLELQNLLLLGLSTWNHVLKVRVGLYT